jgi:hypothetical protein
MVKINKIFDKGGKAPSLFEFTSGHLSNGTSRTLCGVAINMRSVEEIAPKVAKPVNLPKAGSKH